MKSPFCRLFLHNLRVCYQNFFPKNTIDNCSVCGKCIRTQLAFIANDIPIKKLPFMPFQEKWLDNIHIMSNNFTIWKNLYRYLQKIKFYDRKELLLAKLRWLFKREKIDIN